MTVCAALPAAAELARNLIIHADVPDMAMIRVGDTYYMSSTTMHLSPGLPIMKSKDLVNWELVSYTIPHFMGYRLGLFNYATKSPGGFAEFDYFRVAARIQNAN